MPCERQPHLRLSVELRKGHTIGKFKLIYAADDIRGSEAGAAKQKNDNDREGTDFHDAKERRLRCEEHALVVRPVVGRLLLEPVFHLTEGLVLEQIVATALQFNERSALHAHKNSLLLT